LLSDCLDGDVFVWIGIIRLIDIFFCWISVAVVAVYCCTSLSIHLAFLSHSTMGLLSLVAKQTADVSSPLLF
jgi:hypothetical protein